MSFSRERKMQRCEELRGFTMHLTGIPDRKEKEWKGESLKSIMAENF